MRTIFFVISAVLFLSSGCANFGLQSSNESTVTDSISESSYKVTFCGNAYMEQQEAEKLAMQRACELTLKKGYDYFAVMEKTNKSEICMLSDMSRGTYANVPEKPTPGSFAGNQSLVRPNMTLKIKCYKKESAPKDAIDAQQYLDDNYPGLKFQ